ncbi:MAG: hypothetical protein M0Z66_12770 [Thermaerobacter sp.]|nr:hypothetical protein [Thermaerobacter sp.]
MCASGGWTTPGADPQDAIRDSTSTLFMIMSFIVLFSVLIRVLDATGAMVTVH